MADDPPIDARGMKCPWPALRLARAMRLQGAALLIADDPAAPREIAELAEQHGWALDIGERDGAAVFHVSRVKGP